MSKEPFYCPIVIRSARMYENPEPEELCDNEVEVNGDICGFHDEDSRREAEAEDYAEALREERHLEERYGNE